MRKAFIFFAAFSLFFSLISPTKVFAGTWTSSSADTYYTGGNVGIGTTTPFRMLQLHTPSVSDYDPNYGTLMVGEASGSMFLTNYRIVGGITLSSTNIGMNAYLDGVNGWKRREGGVESWIISTSNRSDNGGSFDIYRGNATGSNNSSLSTTSVFRINSSGTAYVKQLVVKDPSAGWPDYVFEDNYNLITLKEIEEYIKTNKHLPGIPTAETIKQEGITVGEMQIKQMEKIEELTLHLIEKDKEVNNLKEENLDLKARLENIEKALGL